MSLNTLFPVQLQLCSLSSGSSGNCYFIGSSSEGILVDAGISARRIRKTLEEIGLSMSQIRGVLITHDHIDHIQALTLLTKKYRLPVYCTEGTWKGILRNRTTFDLDQEMFRPLKAGVPFSLAGFTVEAFPVSHDALDAVGYHIANSSRSIALATDLGIIGEAAAACLRRANVLVIESNYDEEMLLKGRYPQQLKQRVHGVMGHLCNTHASGFISDHYHPGISHILLCHLSAENNTPDKALQTLRQTLDRKGVSLSPATVVRALPRGSRSELFVIE
ncbi:MBL fold metallo-hydrolase [Lentimicrobium sp.]|uniref:MBL fold metallo-hydrolase n=1 Tax=Lentimicrobium sp. TaxID=2034841 RepID=UPI0025DABD8E|nr:MBL fold metallo-hydrolase [Lentimicrobium sp.]MCO5258229.1 MBL fold metallo-hydrolase [Lentimicrobium sp.]HOP14621.1 MBL fold metallo-hydrolase [Lentimicrobium sp.]HPF65965.1 MBL fold metallo-hydrolase [Lentimicrobium sp.]HPJ63857.1 MBL fold metallo-hydrolase [Lentimicrobium sp.]HPR27616.1 MBL fold metallo-hydrolase [Lentimicrobium sp.]